MTGFSADWLALREPVDHRSRNVALRDRAADFLAPLARPEIIDLGCGSGSNLRALAPHFPERQSWRLVDHDPALLDAARAALTAWADRAERGADGALAIEKSGKRIDVAFQRADLANDLEKVFDQGCDLVSAAALFDLVGADWIGRFCAALAARKLPLYTVLTYNGLERWTPPHVADADMLAVFHAHQASDKGFGRAAGPRASEIMARGLAREGYEVALGDSPWELGVKDASLIAALAEGSANAVAETGALEKAVIDSWRAARRAASACVIGHTDLFARPKS